MGRQSRACRKPGSLSSRSSPRNSPSPPPRPSTATPAGTCIASWPATARRPRRRRPALAATTHRTRSATPEPVRDRIIELRLQLTKHGLDAGPVTIAWHLEQEGHRPPSTSTIRRILHAAGLVTPEPTQATPLLLPPLRGRPAQRVLAVRLHPLAPGRRHRRRDPQLARRPLPLPARLHRPHPGHRRHRRQHLPHRRRRARLPRLDADRQRPRLHRPLRRREERLRVPPRRRSASPRRTATPATPRPRARSNGSTRPSRRWLAQQPPAATLADLQAQLDRFRDHLQRPPTPPRARPAHPGHRLRRAAQSRPQPADAAPGHYRLRYDRLDTLGKMSFRRAGRMHHLGVGYAHARKRVLAIADDTTVTVIDLETGEILSTHHIDPDQDLLAQHTKSPGPMARELPDVTPMSRLRCHLCRDSSHGGAEGIRTPDLLIANKPVRYLGAGLSERVCHCASGATAACHTRSGVRRGCAKRDETNAATDPIASPRARRHPGSRVAGGHRVATLCALEAGHRRADRSGSGRRLDGGGGWRARTARQRRPQRVAPRRLEPVKKVVTEFRIHHLCSDVGSLNERAQCPPAMPRSALMTARTATNEASRSGGWYRYAEQPHDRDIADVPSLVLGIGGWCMRGCSGHLHRVDEGPDDCADQDQIEDHLHRHHSRAP